MSYGWCMKATSAKEAKSRGLKQYHTGVPCHKGHVAPRFTSNHCCVECRKTISKKSTTQSAIGREGAKRRRLRYASSEKGLVVHKKANNKSRFTLKSKVIGHYGGACACCGQSQLIFLNIDHINQDGAEHRRVIGASALYRWLVKNNYPEGFRVLCFNCNIAMYRLGHCPCGVKHPCT